MVICFFHVFYMATHLLLRHYYGLTWKQHRDSVELEAPDMIRQQNVFLYVKPRFDQFCSVSSSECVSLCGDKVSRKAYGCIHTLVMICFISRRSERNRQSIVSSFSLTVIYAYTKLTEAFCVSPSATDLPFVYSALPGYSLWFGCAHVTLRQFLLCSTDAKNSLSLPWLHS